MKRMETDEILLIIIYAQGGGAEDGFQPFVQFEILVIDEFVHLGVILPKQGLERLVTQDDTFAIVLVAGVESRTGWTG